MLSAIAPLWNFKVRGVRYGECAETRPPEQKKGGGRNARREKHGGERFAEYRQTGYAKHVQERYVLSREKINAKNTR